MLPVEFAAQRRERLTRADDELHGVVAAGLAKYADGVADWEEEILDAASQLWIEHFEAEAPGRAFERPLARFRDHLQESLGHTTEPEGDITDGMVDRVTKWLSVYTVNNATVTGAFGRGITHKRWVTMHDASVREIHEAVDGQIVPIGGAFNVGGSKLGFPGEPVGPPEVWINCRCLAQPAARDGEAMSLQTHTIGPEDEVEDDNPDVVVSNNAFAAAEGEPDVEPGVTEAPVDDEPEEGEELITEIPIHGVATVEDTWTGDRRFFEKEAVTWRDLPLPYRYTPTDLGRHDGAVSVGRLDSIERVGNEIRYEGAIVLNRPYATEVIEGLISGVLRGVSVDVDDIVVNGRATEAAMEEAMAEFEATGNMRGEPTVYAGVRIAGLTSVAIPAFQEGWTALGTWADAEADVEGALTACGCSDGPVELEEIPDEEFREIPAEQRKKDASQGKALPDGSFPIENVEDLRNAIQAIGRAKDPAAAKAHIKKRARALGHPELIPEGWAAEGEAFAPGTHDGPGWITHPNATKRIRNYWTRGAGAAKIGWGTPGDFNRCRAQLAKYVQNPDWLAGLCANMHYEVLKKWPGPGKGPGRHALEIPEGAERAPGLVLTAAGNATSTRTIYPSEFFQLPQDAEDRAFPQRIDRESRRIYGYLAQWGVCHIGVSGACIEPPPSTNGYAYFLKGVVDTDAGEQKVGTLTYGIGHANERLRAAAATAHYDRIDAVRAYVNIGEDVHGIWFAGVLAPWVTDEDIDALRAIGSLSGDWRDWGNASLDLVAAVSVNTPGFQLAASGGRQISLIAAGRIEPEPIPSLTASGQMDAETIAAISRNAIAEYRHQERVAAKLDPVRAKIKERKLALARSRMRKD